MVERKFKRCSGDDLRRCDIHLWKATEPGEVNMWRLAIMGVRLIVVAVASQSAVLVGTRLIHRGELQDPLASYTAIMPGQPVENLEPYACNWYVPYHREDTIGVCQLNPGADRLVSVSVSVTNLAVYTLTFDVSGYTVGDLTQLWGRPVIGNYRGLYSVRWYRDGCVVSAPLSRRFSYRQPVRYFFVIRDQTSQSGEHT